MNLGGRRTFFLLLNLFVWGYFIEPANSSVCGALSDDCPCSIPATCCFKLEENSPPGTLIGDLVDLEHTPVTPELLDYFESDRSLDFAFQENAICNNQINYTDWVQLFDISNKSRGIITANQGLDHEYYRELCGNCLQLFVTVSYIDDPPNSGGLVFTFSINLVDLNDNEPQFIYTVSTNSTVFTSSVMETNQINMSLFCSDQLIATDADTNGIITYTVLQSPPKFRVLVDGNQLCVENLIPLDRETTDNVTFVIRAEDEGPGNVTKSSELTSVLTLLDINDNPPYFIDPMNELNVYENATIGTVITQFLAADEDNGSNALIEYSISSTDPVPFYINSSTGDLIVNGSIDADIDPKSYSFDIVAQDGPGLATTLQITIYLLDVNDNPPTLTIITPVVTFSEGYLANDSFITVLTFEDADATAPNWSAVVTTGMEYAMFQNPLIDIVSGMYFSRLLFSVKKLDYETTQQILIDITISDGGNPPLTDSGVVLINITDVNDNRPNLTKTEFNVMEGLGLGRFLVNLNDYFEDRDSNADGNNKTGTFVLLSNDPYVRITDNAVLVKELMDRESIPGGEISFEVMLFDKGSPPLNSTVTITLNLLDINDNPPVFDAQSYQFMVLENQDADLDIGQVVATDSDNGSNGSITYSLLNFNDLFSINSTTGLLSLHSRLDRETQSEYNLTVVASDQGTPPLSTSINVTINVKDLNDNPPMFQENTVTNFTVNSSATVGTVVGEMQAFDEDIGMNALINYELSNVTLFMINNSGMIFTTSVLEQLSLEEQLLVVTAFNSNSKNMNSTIDIRVLILRTNSTNSTNNTKEEQEAPLFGPLQLYTSIAVAAVLLVLAILVVLCCICCLCYHRRHSQSKDLPPLPASIVPKNSILKSSTMSMSKEEEPTPINGEVPRSPTVIFSDECQVRYFSQDQSTATTAKSSGKTETVRFEDKFNDSMTESPQIPTKDVPEVEEVSSPPLSEDLSSNSSLSNSVYHSTAATPNQYYENPPTKDQHLPLRADTLKKHNEAISENYGGHTAAMLYPPQAPVGSGHHERMYQPGPPEPSYVASNGHYPHGPTIRDDHRDDDFDGLETLPPNIQHYLSNHHSNQSISAPVSHYVSQNGTPPSTDSSPRIQFVHHHGHHRMTPHKSSPAVYYSHRHQHAPPPISPHAHYTIDQAPVYYDEPPPTMQQGLQHYTSSSSSSSSTHHVHRPDLSPPSPPPQSTRYPPIVMHHPIPRHGRHHSHERPTIDGHLSPLDEYPPPHIGPNPHSPHGRTHHVSYPHHHMMHPPPAPGRLYSEISRQSFAPSEDTSTVASSLLDNYLQFDTHLPKPGDYLLSDAISVDDNR